MAEAAPKSNNRKKIERPFPRRTLEESLRVPRAIKEHNAGNPWTPDQVAKAMNVAARSANFFYLTASSRDFGFTEGTRDAASISLTDLGRKAVYPKDQSEEHQAKMKAFLNIDAFRQLLEYYKGNNLPEDQFLSNVLTTQFHLDPEIHAEFRDLFDKNCRYLGIGTTYPLDNTHVSSRSDTDSEEASVSLAKPRKTQGSSDEQARTCFIIMPFTEREDKHSPGFFEEVLTSLLIPAITEAGFEARSAQRKGSDVIQATIVNELLEADLIVADLTEHNPNVLFELGMRMAEDKPTALVRAKGTGEIFDVDNMLRVADYDPNLWSSTVKTDLPVLTEHIKATWDNRGNGATFRTILEQRKV